MSRDFQQCGILTSVDSGEPVQPPVKHMIFGRIFKRLEKALIKVPICTGDLYVVGSAVFFNSIASYALSFERVEGQISLACPASHPFICLSYMPCY